jgi:hypothetical protein
MARRAINLVAFQAAWFATVLTAAQGRPWAGIATVALVVILHLAAERWRAREIALLTAAGLLGYGLDSSLVLLEMIRFPLWMVGLWVSFGTILHVSLGWLSRRLALASVLGLVGGPLAYWSGMRLGAIELREPLWQSAGAVAIEWALATPLLLYLTRFAGREET